MIALFFSFSCASYRLHCKIMALLWILYVLKEHQIFRYLRPRIGQIVSAKSTSNQTPLLPLFQLTQALTSSFQSGPGTMMKHQSYYHVSDLNLSNKTFGELRSTWKLFIFNQCCFCVCLLHVHELLNLHHSSFIKWSSFPPYEEHGTERLPTAHSRFMLSL